MNPQLLIAPSTLSQLRSLAAIPSNYRVMPFGEDALDSQLSGRGLRAGALHEATTASCSLADEAASTHFVAGIAARETRTHGGPVLWAATRTDLYAPGLAQAGLAADEVIYAQPRDDASLLAVIEDAVRDGTPSAVVGEVGRLSMIASRRLQLVAADADIPILLLRRLRRREEDPCVEPSAAWTRWRIASAPSQRLEVAGVGRARWMVELVRQRGGEGFSLIVEGCDETGRLAVPTASGRRPAEAVGTVHATAA